MAVAILIALWIYDEISFNKNFENYDQVAQVMQHQTFNGDVGTQTAVPYLMGTELKSDYGSDFKYVSMASWTNDHILAFGEKRITTERKLYGAADHEMLSLKMLEGTKAALNDEHA